MERTVAIGNFDAMMQQMNTMQMAQAQARQQAVGPALTPCSGTDPGTLIIADFFQPSNDPVYSHGEMVNISARRDGFQGPVRTLAQPNGTQRVESANLAKNALFNPKLTPEQSRNAVAFYAKNQALDVLESQTRMVDSASASGAKNSVLNLSMGGSVAQTTGNLYVLASGAWDPKETQKVRDGCLPVAKNLAQAYDLSIAKLTSSDPKISGPERARLQAALAGNISGSLAKDAEVTKAEKTFATAVGRFESQKNSVVISSGNEGDIQEQMQKDAHGYQAKGLPKDFETNYLDTPNATMVGATRWFKTSAGPQERVAAYSNVNSGVDIYASGSLDLKKDGKGADTFGTSFAAPRVAAMMASLHKANPNMSSAQIEHLMKTKFTHQLQNGNSSVAVLDFHKYSDFMVGRRSPE